MIAVPLLVIAATFLFLNLLFPLPGEKDYSCVIRDKQGRIAHAYLSSDEKWRMNTALDEISPLLQKTIIAKEDKYFFYHPGVNPLALIRAVGMNMLRMKRTSGASTITMQVARMLEKRPRTYWSKLVETFRAMQLEWKYSKKEILQLYLNLVPYGSNIEGVKAASLLYFGKDPDHLSLAEITSLSIIPNRPSSLVPGKHNDVILAERNKWLHRLGQKKVFPEEQISDALEEPMNATRGRFPRMIPHLSRRLKQQGSSEVITTVNLEMQWKLEKIVQDYTRNQRLKGIKNAAVIVVDNSNGQVLSYVGSADFNQKDDAGEVDGITAIRQPGSTLKPLVYGLCIDEGLMTPRSVLTDVAVNYAGYVPENYDRTFSGYVTVEDALSRSLNIPAVNALKMFGAPQFTQVLASVNFRQVAKDQKKLGLSMILGGCGASLEELTGLYSCLANGGKYRQLQYTPGTGTGRTREIISESAAFMITEILTRTDRPDFPLNWQSTEKMPQIAWKTGTSYGRRDAWSIGYNKRFTVGVWLGNFSGTSAPELTGANTATPLLFRIFNTIDYDSDQTWFEAPAECASRTVCSETGLIPGGHCEHIVSDYYIPLVSTMKTCDNMEEISISADGRHSFCKSCLPSNGYRKKLFRKITPAMQSYFDDRRIAYERVPPHNAECTRIFSGSGPWISSLHNGTEYLISRSNPEPLMLACKTSSDAGRIYWYINNKFYKSAEANSSQFFMPSEGRNKISCTDDKGRNRDIWIDVRYVDL